MEIDLRTSIIQQRKLNDDEINASIRKLPLQELDSREAFDWEENNVQMFLVAGKNGFHER